ncbi:MAG: transporter substrate-binding domain-containing protein [Candidatus Aminicenantes bacterium]|nr:transporter substrate-binding domain-containing protein [Candidatus Aminicenantes bacterium]
MANRITRTPWMPLGAFLLLGLLGLIFLQGCNMETKEIRKEFSRLEQITAAGKLVVGTSADYPPYEFHLLPEMEGEMVGIDIDIAEAIAANLNVKLEIRDIVFSKLFEELKAGRIDLALAGLSPTENRKLVADFSIPYYQAIQNMLIRAEDKDRIHLVEDLRGKVVGTQKGSIQEDLARNLVNGATFFLHEDIEELIAALKQRKIDAVILEKPVADTYAFRHKELINLQSAADTQPLYSAAAVRKGDHELLERVNQVLEKLIRENKITESIQAAKLFANKI